MHYRQFFSLIFFLLKFLSFFLLNFVIYMMFSDFQHQGVCGAGIFCRKFFSLIFYAFFTEIFRFFFIEFVFM